MMILSNLQMLSISTINASSLTRARPPKSADRVGSELIVEPTTCAPQDSPLAHSASQVGHKRLTNALTNVLGCQSIAIGNTSDVARAFEHLHQSAVGNTRGSSVTGGRRGPRRECWNETDKYGEGRGLIRSRRRRSGGGRGHRDAEVVGSTLQTSQDPPRQPGECRLLQRC
ncbi:hypothetical protein J6590_036019 [Homalodisca vitripennis]|nr:hypothetical protein J6590_036019 [Homalodisca vitripennis]